MLTQEMTVLNNGECGGLAYAKIDPDDVLTMASFRKWFNRLEKLMLSRFYWEVPDTCNNREIERTLFYQGRVLIFCDRMNGRIYSLPFNPKGGYGMYREPLYREAFADNGYTRDADIHDSVIVWDNPTWCAPVWEAAECAQQIAEIEAAMRVNVEAQKTPYILRGEKRIKTTLEAIFKKIRLNKPAIYADTQINADSISVLNTESPERYLTLCELRERVWNDTLNSFGITTANTWKRERLVGAEAESADDLAVSNRVCAWNTRVEALEKLRKMFPEERWELRYNFDKEGDVYGLVHDGDLRTSDDAGRQDDISDG